MSYSANPRHPGNHPASADAGVPQEPTGPIAADSLAAESLKQGGDFAAHDPNAVPLGVPGSKSTLNTTDTSGAVPLPPAASGAERERQEAKGLGSDEKGASGIKYPEGAGQPDFSGTHTATGEYYGGPSGTGGSSAATQTPAGASDFGATTTTSSSRTGGSTGAGNITSSTPSGASASSGGATSGSKQSTNTNNTTSSTTSTSASGIRPHVDAAPNYAARVSGAISNSNELQPKGSDLTEGGDVPEGKKTFTGDVGGSKDPGRLGEQNFEAINAKMPGGGVARDQERDGATDVGGQYGVLGANERA